MCVEAFFTDAERLPTGYHAPSGAPEPPDVGGVGCDSCIRWMGGDSGVCRLEFEERYYDRLRGLPHYKACEGAALWVLENLKDSLSDACDSWREG